ncbi:TIM barrel protein [Lentisphaera marina]|uniref:sugar phosphate isomerase/epimerase family protein n=1 Tax=Lentisphaera marina TaxID=1111041 RepID=UPI0023665FF5|nr:TIM barrel protein [Lentisphaera marina]MDD7986142.1 TIM barrel protein [Lentisphaera marina]
MSIIKISLAQWSLHKRFQSGALENLDFPAFTRDHFDLSALEYVNIFFKQTTNSYVRELKQRCDDNGVKSLLIMCDGLGRLGDPDRIKREKAVENHLIWLELASKLSCHSIRVNAESEGSFEEQCQYSVDGLRELSQKADDFDLNILVENHGGLSSNGAWLSQVMQGVHLENCGTLPDFGNFDDYDKYKGVKEMMPWAKSVSAKSFDFDNEGNEINIDYHKMMQIVLSQGYSSYFGIEYEGDKYSDIEGVNLTIDLLKSFENTEV